MYEPVIGLMALIAATTCVLYMYVYIVYTLYTYKSTVIPLTSVKGEEEKKIRRQKTVDIWVLLCIVYS